LKEMTFQDTFNPKGCNFTLPTTSVTVSAGHTMVEIYTAADAQNQTIVGGAAEVVGIGGYITGTGHSPLSTAHGLAADNVLQATLVTPSGDVLTANECQNSDLFCAFRGGGGSTFGVLLSATLKTYLSPAMTVFELQIVFLESSEAFWDIMTYLLSQYPYLSSQGISGYPYMAPFYPLSATLTGALYSANFADPTSAFGESNITKIFEPILEHIQTTWPGAIYSLTNATQEYASFLPYFNDHHDTSTAGVDTNLRSRLLDVATLSRNQTALKETFKGFSNNAIGSAPFLLGGKGVWEARPRGGSDAVNPAWRKAVAHVGKYSPSILESSGVG
jgi:hypothetical protein